MKNKNIKELELKILKLVWELPIDEQVGLLENIKCKLLARHTRNLIMKEIYEKIENYFN